MDPKTKTKPKGPKLFQLIKALFQCAVLFCIPGLVITFFAPSFTIELTRIDQDRVDAAVTKKLIFIVPVSKYTATGLVDTESEIMDGGVIREGHRSTGRIVGEVEDEGLLLLRGTGGEQIEVWISPKNLADVEYEVRHFITEAKEPSLRLRVVSNWKFGVILPGGILLLCLVIFFMAAWSIITGRPSEGEGAPAEKSLEE